MDKTNKYFALVENRIRDLETKLEKIKNNSDSKSKLEVKFLIEKINYLKKLKDLPLYIAINKIPNEELNNLRKDNTSDNSKSYFIKLFGLESIDSNMKKPKITTFSNIKEAFLDDFNSLYDLITMQNTNDYCKKRIAHLYNGGEGTLALLGINEKRTKSKKENLTILTSSLRKDYNKKTIKEIKHYLNNKDERLSINFIMNHKDKVINNNQQMEKVVSKLTKKHNKLVEKILSKSKKKMEDTFLNSVVEAYNNDTRINTIGLNPETIVNSGNSKINKFLKNLDKQILKKQDEYTNTLNDITSQKSKLLSEIKGLRILQDKTREEFASLIKSKKIFITENSIEQLWNEPAFTESFIKTACYKEEKDLVNELTSPLNQNNINLIENKVIEENNTKKLVA